jgi:hypothetical protein
LHSERDFKDAVKKMHRILFEKVKEAIAEKKMSIDHRHSFRLGLMNIEKSAIKEGKDVETMQIQRKELLSMVSF